MAVMVRRVLLPLLGVALAIGVWWLASTWDDRTPAPGDVLRTVTYSRVNARHRAAKRFRSSG